MLEILKKFEEEAGEEDNVLLRDSDDEELTEEEGLAERLGELDLGKFLLLVCRPQPS